MLPFQSRQPEPSSHQEAWQQLLPVADLPDALLFWVLHRRLPELADASRLSGFACSNGLRCSFTISGLVAQIFPYQVVMREATGSLLKSAPKTMAKPGQWYSRPEAYLPQLQVAWVQGRYEAMWLGFLRGQLDGRFSRLVITIFAASASLVKRSSVLQLFQQLYNRNPSDFQLGSVSNMLFMALGSEQVISVLCLYSGDPFSAALSSGFRKFFASSVAPIAPKTFQVQEKPLLVVVSSDLASASCRPLSGCRLPVSFALSFV